MPEDFVQSIAERVAAIAKKTAESASPVRIGTVLSVNPDGSVNVDDGMGGCARVANVSNQVVSCGSSVVLGLEPPPGNTTDLCQVAFTVDASSKGCPIENRTDDNEVEVVPEVFVFVDDDGNQYDATGAVIGTGAELATVDPAFGYSQDNTDPDNVLCYVGATGSGYTDLQIGVIAVSPDDDGRQGETYSSNNTVLCQGIGVSDGILVGAECENTPDGGHAPVWIIVARDAVTFAELWTDAASYIVDWMDNHGNFFGDDTNYDVNISADPEDGSFWVNVGGNSSPTPGDAGMFNISASDGTLISTVALQVPTAFFLRAKRYAP